MAEASPGFSGRPSRRSMPACYRSSQTWSVAARSFRSSPPGGWPLCGGPPGSAEPAVGLRDEAADALGRIFFTSNDSRPSSRSSKGVWSIEPRANTLQNRHVVSLLGLVRCSDRRGVDPAFSENARNQSKVQINLIQINISEFYYVYLYLAFQAPGRRGPC